MSHHDKKIKYHQEGVRLLKEGKDPSGYFRSSRTHELLHYLEEGITHVAIATAGNEACSSCYAQGGEIYEIKQATKKFPLPCKDCTNDSYQTGFNFCRCWYEPVFNDELPAKPERIGMKYLEKVGLTAAAIGIASTCLMIYFNDGQHVLASIVLGGLISVGYYIACIEHQSKVRQMDKD